MAVSVTINGVTFAYPETGDENWGTDATGWAQAVSSDMLQKSGGSFDLGADANFGASFGLISVYFKSISANIAASGVVRLANGDFIAWRNAGDSADNTLLPTSDTVLGYGGVDIVNLSDAQTLTNKTLTSPTINTATFSGATITGSTIDSSAIGATTPAAGNFSTVDIDGGTVDGTTIGATTPAAGNFTSVTTPSVDTSAAGNMDIGATVGANNVNLGAASSTVVVKGDLQVDGTTTTVSSATLDVADANITVNVGGNDASAEGAGLTAERVGDDGLLQYENALASHWKIGNAAGTSEVATVSNTQTLTNKTLTGNTAASLSPDGAATITFPVATDTLVGKATTDTLTNKTLTSPTITTPAIDGASTYDQVTTPAAPAASHNKLYFKSDDSLYKINSAGEETEVGSGSGSGTGETNYILNPNATVNTDGWVDAGTGLTLSKTTTASELPREPLSATAIKLANEGSGTSYVHYRFSMGDADKNKKLKIQWAQKIGADYTNDDYKVEMYTNTQADYLGTVTEVPLTGDVAGDSFIKASDGVYLNTFSSDASDYYELRIVRVAGTSNAGDFIAIGDVIVGPGTVATSPDPRWPSYSDGVDFTITYTAWTATTTNGSWITPYQDSEGGWYIRGSIDFDHASASGGFTNIPGILFDSNQDQTSAVMTNAAGIINRANFASGGNSIGINHSANQTQTVLNFDVKIQDKPTWATKVGPDIYLGTVPSVVTPWTAFTPTWAGVDFTGDLNWRRVGENMEVYGNVVWATGLTGQMLLTIPEGLSLDTSDLTSTSQNRVIFGSATTDTGSGFRGFVTKYTNTTQVTFFETVDAGANWSNVNPAFTTSNIVGLEFSIPIAEWAGGSQDTATVGFGEATSTQLGLVKGLKSYEIDTAYTNGTPAITGSGVSVVGSSLIPYQTTDGRWHLRLSVEFNMASSASTQVTFSGVTFSSDMDQAIAARGTAVNWAYAYTAKGTSNTVIKSGTAQTLSTYNADLVLDSKPTWAD